MEAGLSLRKNVRDNTWTVTTNTSQHGGYTQVSHVTCLQWFKFYFNNIWRISFNLYWGIIYFIKNLHCNC